MSINQQAKVEQLRKNPLEAGHNNRSLFIIGIAWAFEVFAVFIGVSISLSMGMSAYEESLNSGLLQPELSSPWNRWLNVLIAMTPFFMVAIVELTKIPLTQVLYSSSSVFWKIAFGIVLIFLAVVTFESMFNGFERNFTLVTNVVNSEMKNLVLVEEQIQNLNNKIEVASQLNVESIEKKYNDRVAVLSAERDQQTRAIQEGIQRLRSTIQTEYIKGMRDQAEQIKVQIKEWRAERDTQIRSLNESSASSLEKAESEIGVRRRQLQTRIERLTTDIRKNERRRDAAIENARFFANKDKIREEWANVSQPLKNQRAEAQEKLENLSIPRIMANTNDNLIAATETVRSKFQARIDKQNNILGKINEDISLSLAAREKDIEASIDGYLEDIKSTESRYSEQQGNASNQRKSSLEELEKKAAIVSASEKERSDKGEQRTKIRDAINRKVASIQVYRMAQWAYGAESAADLDRAEVLLIALIWFGTLSAVIALTGIFLAFASEIAKNPNKNPENQRVENSAGNSSKLLASLRRLIIFYRQVKRRPKVIEIVKEVPVDRVVIQDVAKEVVVKELVYVPFYSTKKADVTIQNTKSESKASVAEEISQNESSDV